VQKHIATPYAEVAQVVVDRFSAALETEAARRLEAELDATLARGEPVLVDGVPCSIRVRATSVLVAARGQKLRALPLVEVDLRVARALEAFGARATRTYADLLDTRRRLRLLDRRAELGAELREVGRRREALAALREHEVADADRLRRRLLARERRAGRPVAPGLERPVASIVLGAARDLSQEATRLRVEIAEVTHALEQSRPTALERRERAQVEALRELAVLIGERIEIAYRRYARELVQAFRALAFPPGRRAFLPMPAPSPPSEAFFLRRLAFLMGKANCRPIARAELERGLAIGPAPGVRVAVDLDAFDEAHFFGRGETQERVAGAASPVPRFVKFAYCLKRRRRAASYRVSSAFLRAFREEPPWRRALRRRLDRVAVWIRRRFRRHMGPHYSRVSEYLESLSPGPRADETLEPLLHLRLFGDVRLGEIGLVLPGASLRYRLRDLALVLGGAAGGLVSEALKKPFAALLAPGLLLPISGAAALKGLMGMRQTAHTYAKLRDEYENRHLLASSLAALDFFAREAADADAKEAFLAYAAALPESLAAAAPIAPSTVAFRAERRLRDDLHEAVRFDLHDALGTLDALGLRAPVEDEDAGLELEGPAGDDRFFQRLLSGRADAPLPPEPAPVASGSPSAGPGGLAARLLAQLLAWLRRGIGRDDDPADLARALERATLAAAAAGTEPAAGPDVPARPLRVLPPMAAMRRLRRDLRSALGLEDDPAHAGRDPI